MDDPEIMVARQGVAGVITLNRPGALNALTAGMVTAITAALDAFEGDETVARIVVTGAGRAFCAGGDVRAMRALGIAGDFAGQRAFWRDEYTLNLRIARCVKPFIALIDGACMGGGAGLSIHGSHRIVGESVAFAMPETAIGFAPDVGSTYFLPRLPGRAGAWLATTGARIGAGDMMALGLATNFTPRARFAELMAALSHVGDVDAIIARLAQAPPPPLHAGDPALLGSLFDQATAAALFEALVRAGETSDFVRNAAALMRQRSPTSVALALRQTRVGASLSLEAALALELRIVCAIGRSHDFFEGVRAVLVNRDEAPRWIPSRFEDVDERALDALFDMSPAGPRL